MPTMQHSDPNRGGLGLKVPTMVFQLAVFIGLCVRDLNSVILIQSIGFPVKSPYFRYT